MTNYRLDEIVRRNVRMELDEASRKEIAAAIAMSAAMAGGVYQSNKYIDQMRNHPTEHEVVVDDRYEDERFDNMDDAYVMRFINHSENPDSVGYDKATDRWYAPDPKKYDPNQYGMGTDIRYNGAGKLLKRDENGRKYMTADAEREIRHKNVEECKKSFSQRVKYAMKVTGEYGYRPSEVKRALTLSAIYCKGGSRVAKEIFTPENCEIFVYGSDQEWKKVIDDFYKKHKVSSRSAREQDFIDNNNIA